ncbi:MAG TPA: branched-chain amino acid ABC transporter permease [Burkholderiaceae bacterium]|nr:branched-chain amino acid ABC transporter permease [Burkholderiaceae bacterium]
MRAAATVAAGALACLALGLAFPWTKTPLVTALCYGLAALGVAVLMRAGQVSFGHAMYAAISAYTVVFLARRFPQADALALIAAGVTASLAAGALIGLFVVRYREIFFGMLNLALSMVLYSLLGKFYTVTGGTDGLRMERPTLAGVALERAGYETALLALTLALAVALGAAVQRFYRSAAGEALAGVKTNETRLEYLGLSAQRVLWSGYVISVVLVGLAGALMALLQGLVTPESGYWLRSGEYVFVAILGGAAHAAGAFAGALAFEVIKLFAAAYLTGVWQLLLGAVLIAVILVAPAGISGAFAKARRAGAPAPVAPAGDEAGLAPPLLERMSRER